MHSAGDLQELPKPVKLLAAIQLLSMSQLIVKDEEPFSSVPSALNAQAARTQPLCLHSATVIGEKTDHFWYINELTVQRMNFVSPAPSSPPKEIMEVIKHLDVFHMDVSTSYKVKVDQLGELKTIRKD